jgi:ABC-type glycerol-3-phosphate transport system permease component
MVEHRPWLTFLTHALLVGGCLIIAFPIYVTLVASTHCLEAITTSFPLPPGGHLIENYHRALSVGPRDVGATVGPMMLNYGWNQYLWPLLITTDESYYTLLIGIKRMLDVGEGQAEWQIIMASTMLAMIPPVIIVIFMQKQFVQGMTETEK